MMLATHTAHSASPRFDATSAKSMSESGERIRQSLDAPQLERFRAAYRLLMVDAMCPASVDRPHFDAAFEREARLKASIHGKTADDIIAAAARVQARLDSERSSMQEHPPESPLGSSIRSSVQKYLDGIPAEADNYAAMFPFWTRARVEYAQALKPASTLFDDLPGHKKAAPHSRDPFSLALFGNEWLKNLVVTRVVASPAKAYVFIGTAEKSLRTTFLLESGEWKAHSDFFGYPWSAEGMESAECVEH